MRIQTFIKLTGLFILGVVLWRIDFSGLFRILKSCNLLHVSAALILFNISAFIKAYRWHVIMRHQGIEYAMSVTYRRYLVGLFIGTVTPGRLGEFSRALYVKRDLRISLGTVFSGVLVDRVFDLHLLLTIGLASVFYFRLVGPWSSVFLAAAGILFLLPVVPAHPGLGGRLFDVSLRRLSRLQIGRLGIGEITRFLEGVQRTLQLKLFLRCFLLTAIAYAAFFFAGYLLTRSIAMNVGFHDAALALALANSLSLIPITFAGVGTRDAMLVLSLSIVYVTSEAALAFSLLILFTSYFGTAVFGFVFFISDKPPRNDTIDSDAD